MFVGKNLDTYTSFYLTLFLFISPLFDFDFPSSSTMVRRFTKVLCANLEVNYGLGIEYIPNEPEIFFEQEKISFQQN